MDTTQLRQQAQALVTELVELAGLRAGQLLVVGCSSSEVLGSRIGTASSEAVGLAIFQGLRQVLEPRGIGLVAQCCEHLNRALVIEREFLGAVDIVNAIPQPKAGGSFATAAYQGFTDPVLIEQIRADAGLDIGDTLIGMQLRPVAVPVRLSSTTLGAAHLAAARTRPKFIGGSRAAYDPVLAHGQGRLAN